MATDARTADDKKLGKIPDESKWKLSKNAAMMYYCEICDFTERRRVPQLPRDLSS